MQVAGRRAGRAVMDVVAERAGVGGRAVMRMRVRESVRLPLLLVPERKAGRMRLQMPERAPMGGRSLGCRVRRRGSRGRPTRTGGGVRRRLRDRSVVEDHGLMRNGGGGGRRDAGGPRRRRTAATRGGHGRVRGAGGSGRRGRVSMRMRGAPRSGHDDALRRRRAEARARAERGQLHSPRVEEQRHRRRAEHERNHGHRHSSGDTPRCEPLRASVGRHRPLSPLPGRASLGLGLRDTRNPFARQPANGGDVRCFRGIISDNPH